MQTKAKWGITSMILGALSCIFLIVLAIASGTHIEKVACFDEHHNKMDTNVVMCEKEVLNLPNICWWLLLGIPLFFLGEILYLWSKNELE